jgi:hypothetical protein
MHRLCNVRLSPSAAIVKAARQIDRAASGNASNSFSAALIHETGRVFRVIRPFATSVPFYIRNVVIFDNECQEGMSRRLAEQV